MTKRLHIADGLSLPLDFVTERIAFLARTGAGKSGGMRVLFEEFLEAKQFVVFLDPKGDAWGIRAAGIGPGYPVLVMGGDHGDVPLESSAGKVVAEFLVKERVSTVLDVSDFGKAGMIKFVTDLATTLYRRNRDVLQFMLDEADMVAGEKFYDPHCLEAIQLIQNKGRHRGFGVTVATQRSAMINKTVLYASGTLVAMQTTSPKDIKTVRDWLEVVASAETAKQIVSALPTLKTREALVYSPQYLGSEPSRITFKTFRTFDSMRTPRPGETRQQPKSLADIDLSVVQEDMAATIEKVKAEDPRELNNIIFGLKREITELKKNAAPRERDTKRIQELTEQLAAERAKVKPAGKTEAKEKKIVIAGDLTRLEKFGEKLATLHSEATERASDILTMAETVAGAIREAKELNAQELQVTAPSQALKVFEPGFSKPSAPVIRPREATGARSAASSNGSGDLSPLHRQILNGIALLHNIGEPEPTIAQVGAVIGKSHNAGRIRGGFNQVHEMGYAEIFGNKIRLTSTGNNEAVALDIRSRADIHNLWYQRLKGNELEFLRVLINDFPNSIRLSDLGAAIGKDINAGRIRGALNALFEKGLATLDGDAVTASNLLFPAGLE
jgi:hypothetical protein